MSDKYTQNLIASGADPALISKFQQVPPPKAQPAPTPAPEEPPKARKAAKRTTKHPVSDYLRGHRHTGRD